MARTSGGDEMSWQMAQAISNIKKGDTPKQRARELRQRAILFGIQAGLMGGGGYITGQAAKAEEDGRRSKVRPEYDYTPRQLPGLRDVTGEIARMEAGERAQAMSDQIDANQSAAMAPIPGPDGKPTWSSPQAADAFMADAAVTADDINKSKQIMAASSGGFGGLGNSFAGGRK